MTTRFSKSLIASIVIVVLATPLRADAEPTAADIETARGLYVEGLQLRDAGKLEVSLARFKAAHSLAATPITSLELGRAYAMLSQLAEARDVLVSVEHMPVLASESPKAANARIEARAMVDQVRERMPTLRVVFTQEPSSPPHVTIDGVPMVPDSLRNPYRVNPGSHAILAETADGARASANVVLIEHEARTVALTLGPATGPARVEHPDPTPEAPGPSPWFYVGLGTAGVGIITGTITGLFALSKAHKLEGECTGTTCPRSAEADLSSSRTMGTVSTIAFVVAGAGAVLAVVSWVTRPSGAVPTAIAPGAVRWSW
jgi:hypothetical protein